jgi:hypothetical protein
MQSFRGSSSTAATTARPAGSEAITAAPTSQQTAGDFSVYSPAQLIGYAQAALFDLVDALSGLPLATPPLAPGFGLTGRAAAINRFLLAARDRLDLVDAQVLPEPQRAARQMIQAIGLKNAIAFRNALAIELEVDRHNQADGHRDQLAEMGRTNRELRNLRLAHDEPPELEDRDRSNGRV